MKLSYQRNESVFATPKDTDELPDQDILVGAAKVIAAGLGIAEGSVWYLLDYGWSQSLQDSTAGPTAKAKKDGETEELIEALAISCLEKRMAAIVQGTVGTREARDPQKAVALEMLRSYSKKVGKPLPKDKAKLATLLNTFRERNAVAIKAEFDRRKQVEVEIELD